MNMRTSFIRKAPIVQLFSEVKKPKDLISLGQGIPFFPPPAEVIQKILEGMKESRGFQYTSDNGLEELRNQIVKKIDHDLQVKVDADQQVVVTAGANQAFMNAILSITSPGDEVILFRPSYFNYVMGIQLAGCKPVICNTDKDFHPLIEDMKEKITDTTKAIVTISPNNPTGSVYSSDELRSINEICSNYNLFHISDEVYEYFVYDGKIHTSPLSFDRDINHTIALFSFSKAFGMSGFRIGYMIFPSYLFDDILKVQDTIGICAPSISQIAASTAIGIGDGYVSRFMPVLKENRRIVNNNLSSLQGVDMYPSSGAYYFFISYQNPMHQILY